MQEEGEIFLRCCGNVRESMPRDARLPCPLLSLECLLGSSGGNQIDMVRTEAATGYLIAARTVLSMRFAPGGLIAVRTGHRNLSGLLRPFPSNGR